MAGWRRCNRRITCSGGTSRPRLPYVAANDIGVLAYGPLAHGLLAGRMTAATTFPSDDWRSHSPDFHGDRFRRNLEVVGQLSRFASERGVPLPQLAVAWVIHNPAVDCGDRRRPSAASQLAALTPAAGIELSAADLDNTSKRSWPAPRPSPVRPPKGCERPCPRSPSSASGTWEPRWPPGWPTPATM